MTNPTDELRGLLEKATPGRWHVGQAAPGAVWLYTVKHSGDIAPGPGLERAVTREAIRIGELTIGPREQDDAALIVAAVNALPQLLSQHEADKREIERKDAEIERLREALTAHGLTLLLSRVGRNMPNGPNAGWVQRNASELAGFLADAARQALTPKESADND